MLDPNVQKYELYDGDASADGAFKPMDQVKDREEFCILGNVGALA